MIQYSKLRTCFTSMILFSVIATVFLTACAPAAVSGPRDQCGLIEPTQEEVNKVLSFGKSAFASDDWVKSYSVEPYKVTITRHNDVESAVAYTEYLIYNCGYGQPELDEYFNDAGFAIVFEGYESYNQAGFCEEPNLALYKFDLVEQGSAYTARYWVEQSDDNHVLVMMLVFPRESTAQMEQYSRIIFPKLTDCQE